MGGSKPAPCSVDRRMGDTAPLVAALNRELVERLNGCCVTGYAALSAWPPACLMHPTIRNVAANISWDGSKSAIFSGPADLYF